MEEIPPRTPQTAEGEVLSTDERTKRLEIALRYVMRELASRRPRGIWDRDLEEALSRARDALKVNDE